MRIVGLVGMIEGTVEKGCVIGRKAIAVIGYRRPIARACAGNDLPVVLTPRKRRAGDLTAEVVEDESPCMSLHLLGNFGKAKADGPFRNSSRLMHLSPPNRTSYCGPRRYRER